MSDQTIVCRCEDVTREDILAAINAGCRTLDEIKRVTRAGMGPCQGRTCRNLIAQELAKIYGISVEDVLMPTFRAPVEPVKVGVLAQAYQEEEGENK